MRITLSIVCFILFGVVYAKPPEVIRQAQELLLKKERSAAAILIQDAILKERNPRIMGDLQKELSRLMTLFLTNEGQRLYEMAESIRFSGQSGYTLKYEEALATEGEQYLILRGLAFGFLAQKNCKKAKEYIDGAVKLNPYTS